MRAPSAATPEIYTDALARWRLSGRGGVEGAINTTGHLSVGIPGAIAGLWEAHRRLGRRPWRELVGPAIDLARDGIEVDPRLTVSIATRAAEIRHFDEASAVLLPDGVPPRPIAPGGPGHCLDFRDMARTLDAIAEKGASAFYESALAMAIDRAMREACGLLTATDLAAYRPDLFLQPWHSYRRWEYATCGNLISVECLNILERFDLAALAALGPETLHLVVEALAQSFVDNFAHAADPRHRRSPLEGLASKKFAAEQARRIRLDQAQPGYSPGAPWLHQGAVASMPPPPFEGTTQICAGDADGNVVSLITSLGSAFGSLVLVPETGVFLGNAMQWFDPQPGRANSVGPARMPLYAAPAAIFRRDGRTVGAAAGSGGYRIQPAVLFAAINHLDHGYHPQAAIDAPRLHTEGNVLELDSRIEPAVAARLATLGHRIRLIDATCSPTAFGRPSAAWRTPDGSWVPASDVRAGGVAAY